jgi:thiol-disulfide isomerase/thioredoxin
MPTDPVPTRIGGEPPAPSAPDGPAPTRSPAEVIPEPDDISVPPAARPQNVAEIPPSPRSPFAPPTANIPGPNAPRLPVPPPSAPAPAPPRPQPGDGQSLNFRLFDPLERVWDYPADKSGRVVLLEFVSTNCPACKAALPVLRDLQSRHAAAGLQVVAVMCDEAPFKARAAAAGKYGQDNATNYPVFVEPGQSPGAVRDSLGVEAYPTVVLIDAAGKRVFTGNPLQERAQLEAAIRAALGK